MLEKDLFFGRERITIYRNVLVMAAELADLFQVPGSGIVRLLLVATIVALGAVAFSITVAYLCLVPNVLTVRERPMTRGPQHSPADMKNQGPAP